MLEAKIAHLHTMHYFVRNNVNVNPEIRSAKCKLLMCVCSADRLYIHLLFYSQYVQLLYFVSLLTLHPTTFIITMLHLNRFNSLFLSLYYFPDLYFDNVKNKLKDLLRCNICLSDY